MTNEHAGFPVLKPTIHQEEGIEPTSFPAPGQHYSYPEKFSIGAVKEAMSEFLTGKEPVDSIRQITIRTGRGGLRMFRSKTKTYRAVRRLRLAGKRRNLGKVIVMDVSALPKTGSWPKIFEIYQETGMLPIYASPRYIAGIDPYTTDNVDLKVTVFGTVGELNNNEKLIAHFYGNAD